MERKLSIFFFPFSYDDVMFTKKSVPVFGLFFVVQFFFLVSGVLLTHYHYSNTDMTRLQKERREGGKQGLGAGGQMDKAGGWTLFR